MLHRRRQSPGQVLVLFVLFLLVLLGISAVAIDYASWLLTDRYLQNVADHAALAGASVFDDRTVQGTCSGGSGGPKCDQARAQAWASINDELSLGLPPAAITQLSLSDSGANGTTTVTAGGTTYTWVDRVWITTPPPTYAAYTTPSIGGRYALNFGVVYARVDRNVRSFIGGALGVQPQARHGWATAGALPTDFALETFCRNNISPQTGVCPNSAGLTIDGQGGITLIRGDIASNESLTVTANTGSGVVVQSGNVFLVNRTCSSGTWNCPNSPPQGGISDGVNAKNAFYMAPLPVPHFESPINANTRSVFDCSTADPTHLCVPFKDQGSANPSAPGPWTCSTSSSSPARCGTPSVTVGTGSNPSTVTCVGAGGGNPGNHYYPIGPSLSSVNATPTTGSNATKYQNIDDVTGDPDTLATPQNPSADFLWTDDINITGSGGPQTTSFTVNLGQSGPRLAGTSTVRYTAFKTDGGVPDNTQNPVTLQVRLLPGSGSTAIAVDPTVRTLTDVPQRFEFTVGAGVIPAAQFNSLRLEFTFTSQGLTTAADERGGAIAWAEIEHPDPQPALPPFIPPGYYQSITVPAGGCAILDPTAEYSSLKPYQMPGIYRIDGGNSAKIELGSGSYLIGDGVTFVFDEDFPPTTGGHGLVLSSSSALVINTMRVPGLPTCTPSETETLTLNQSDPLSSLPMSAVCAAWGVDINSTSLIRPGANAWAYCDPANISNPQCVDRSSYNPTSGYRGITFYFTPSGNNWPPSSIPQSRFDMTGGGSNTPGIEFRGVLYAPYDDVKITGSNNFNTVGQVLAWSAKFNGGSAGIVLDYPYDSEPAPPYLLEPTVDH